MGDVAKEGRTVLFVSHNVGAISSLCSKTLYLVEGRIRAIGPSPQIVADYLSEVFQNKGEDLAHARLPGYGKQVRFCDIRLLSNGRSQLLSGDPIEYALAIESEVDLEDLTIGSSIFNGSGTCVGTLFTQERFSVGVEQRLRLRLTLSNVNLAPGSYYAGFSIGRGGDVSPRQDFDIVIGNPAFQVLPVAEGRYLMGHWSPNWGNIVFKDAQLIIGRD